MNVLKDFCKAILVSFKIQDSYVLKNFPDRRRQRKKKEKKKDEKNNLLDFCEDETLSFSKNELGSIECCTLIGQNFICLRVLAKLNHEIKSVYEEYLISSDWRN